MSTSPKQRFLEEKDLARQWFDMSATKAFERAVEISMLQLTEEASELSHIKGAQKFVEILRSIAEQPKPLSPRLSHNLNHELK